MRGEWVDVSGLQHGLLAKRREQLQLTKAETARRMFAYIVEMGPGARNDIALTGSGFAWATERACRRAVDDLENGTRTFKEEQYVDSLSGGVGARSQKRGSSGVTTHGRGTIGTKQLPLNA